MSQITYPARITSYYIFFNEDQVELQLSGVGEFVEVEEDQKNSIQKIANIEFVPIDSSNPVDFKSFTNRGGFLQVTRPLYLLTSILVVLEQRSSPLFIDGQGNLFKKSDVAS